MYTYKNFFTRGRLNPPLVSRPEKLMLAKRVIPCLDVHDGQVTRGVQFGKAEAGELRNVGDPVELALEYNRQGADEMVFFDITASAHERKTIVDVIERAGDQCFMPLTVGGGIRTVEDMSTMLKAGADEMVFFDITASAHERKTIVDVIERAGDQCFMPLTVGGGIRTVEDMSTMLKAGADKVSINSSAIANPPLIREGAQKFGSQCIVVSIDAKKTGDEEWRVFTHGGRKEAGLDAIEWAKEAVTLGAGEIVLNSIDADGTKAGYDIEITRRISENVGVPVVASGGAGNLDHMVDVLKQGQAAAVLAASIFHFGEYTVADVKSHLAQAQIPVRMV